MFVVQLIASIRLAHVLVRPIADRVGNNLGIIFRNFRFDNRRTRNLWESWLLPGTNRESHGQNSGLLNFFFT